jgi:hypothetical protein
LKKKNKKGEIETHRTKIYTYMALIFKFCFGWGERERKKGSGRKWPVNCHLPLANFNTNKYIYTRDTKLGFKN